MKKTRFLQKILSSLTAITFVSLSGNTALAGENISFPGEGGVTEIDKIQPNDPSDNTVTISDGKIGGNVYGGYSENKAATGNTVTISDGKIGRQVYGGYSENEVATGNTVTISGGEIGGKFGGNVYGGYSYHGVAVTGNTVTISGGEIEESDRGEGNVYGGSSGTGSVTENTVTISGGKIGGNVCGGYSNQGVATGNTVTISGGEIGGYVYGGDSNWGATATSNTITISNGKIGRNVYGGWAWDGEATGNTVTISGGTIEGSVGGGSSLLEAVGNTITISNGKIGGNVYGGASREKEVVGNTITVSEGQISGAVYGGFSNEGKGAAIDNTVTISGGKISGDVYGGYSYHGVATGNTVTTSGETIGGNVYGGWSENEAATGNAVTISGGKISGDVYGGWSENEAATGNAVTISGGEIGGYVCGGNSNWGTIATDNTVTISGGEIGEYVCGGYSYSGEATRNTVTISGGEISEWIYGGRSYVGVATGNTVTISGGKISGDVYGGVSNLGSTATGNTVILDYGANLSATASIFGGFSDNTDADVFSGNKLVLNDFQGTVKHISNFEFIDITSSGKEGDMLTLAGGEETNLSQSKVSITFTGISHPFNEGDKIKLIKNEAGITMGDETLQQEGQKQLKSTVYIYDLAFGWDDTSIHAIVESKELNERSKALAEGRVASMAHLNMGADLIAGQGMAQALDSDQLKGKIHLFSAMAATNSQYDTGSHVDLYGYSALVGASLAPAALPSLNCGVFAESGWGHYGSFSDFEDGAVRGSGSTQYYGGGLLTHYDFTKMGIKGLTVEASFRAGKTDADYQSGDLTNSKYDLSTPYYGVHAGVNYTRELSAKLKIANYARFFWSHLDGDNTSIEGSDFRFRTMDSQRIKAGSRLFYEIAPDITPYAGLSYEWECSGTARAVVDGVHNIAAPSLRGGTGTGELGAVWKPMAHQAFWVDFSAQGHIGERQGVSGVVRVRAEF